MKVWRLCQQGCVTQISRRCHRLNLSALIYVFITVSAREARDSSQRKQQIKQTITTQYGGPGKHPLPSVSRSGGRFFPPRCKREETPPGVYLPHQGLYVRFMSTDPARYLRLRLAAVSAVWESGTFDLSRCFSSSTRRRDSLSLSLQGSRDGENEGIFGEEGADLLLVQSAHTHFFFVLANVDCVAPNLPICILTHCITGKTCKICIYYMEIYANCWHIWPAVII